MIRAPSSGHRAADRPGRKWLTYLAPLLLALCASLVCPASVTTQGNTISGVVISSFERTD